MYFSTDPLSKETVRDVFGKDIQLSLATSHDLGGVDIHGDLFLYYEYNLSASEIEQMIRQDRVIETEKPWIRRPRPA